VGVGLLLLSTLFCCCLVCFGCFLGESFDAVV